MGKHKIGKSLVEEFTPFHMEVLPFHLKRRSYWMDTRMWGVKRLEKMLNKKGMYTVANKMRALDMRGSDLLAINNKTNIKIQAELQDWRNLLAFRDECRRNTSACILQRAIRQHCAEAERKKYMYCSHIVSEIISTEQTYVQQLDVVVDLIMNPLKKANAENEIINEDQMRTIFFTLGNIQATNHALLDNLINRCTIYSQSTCIGDVFLEFTPFLKMYSDYCKGYNNISELVGVTLKAPHPFAKFVAEQMKKAPADLQHHALTSLLITPVQRLPRYKLLLADLLKHYNGDHPDYANLRNAYDEVNKVALYVNEMSRMQESTEMILHLTNITKNLPAGFNLCDPSRVYVSRNDVTLYETIKHQQTVMVEEEVRPDDEDDDEGDSKPAEPVEKRMVEKVIEVPETVENAVTVLFFNDITLFVTNDISASVINVGMKLFSYVGLTRGTTYEGFIYYRQVKNSQLDVKKIDENLVKLIVHGEESMLLEFKDEKTRDEWFTAAQDYTDQQKALARSLDLRKSGVYTGKLLIDDPKKEPKKRFSYMNKKKPL